MKFIYLLAPLSLVAGVMAAAHPRRDSGWQDCLSQTEAESIVNQYISILEHTDVAAANATAQSLLDANYTETSDSILSLEGLPLGTATFVGKDVYIDGTLSSPGLNGITTIEILVAGCTKVLWYWNFLGVGSGQYEVKGFNLFTITDSLQISETHLEFNSIAWGLDTGYQVIFPSSPAPTRK
ncbi:uncharacterized protein Z520_08932 [Fonsecaea multimorphosa CBS 102226]|uniref:NTF2-like domain-containing protein n=1 Tax=Fonsecaea multimorphosa CBS 102226 TaxID=1442371 RepID=A0A0D2H0V6_9EURO|nr:uncharacterized protein Z520_08932 [Fonsecaea multimorphosa CBS 102226]KIX95415.1 hypothetical protein Z520_08932 [Fonsecaea multimorphosa CBS 102226]OAL20946.1 hypothetical protein AYO22_08366 [Fonsecaea multimorphosa]